MNFICIGRPEKNYKNNLCNIIYVPFKIDIFELFNFLQLIFNKIKSWDEKITNIIYSSMDVSKIFEVTKDILPFHMQLIDKDLFVIAKSDDLFFKKYQKIAPLDEINKMILEKDFKEAYSIDGIFNYTLNEENFICFNIFQNGKYEARLIAYVNGFELSKGDYILFQNLCSRIEEMYQRNLQMLRNTTNEDEFHRLLKSLLFNKLEYNNFNIDNILEEYNWKKNDFYQVIKINKLISDSISISSLYFCTYLEFSYDGTCAIEYETSIIWVINYNKVSKKIKNNLRQELSTILRENLCKAGVSNIFDNILDLNAYFKQANRALFMGNIIDKNLWCYRFEDYKVKYLMNQCIREFNIEQIVPHGLLSLKKYDTENNTELCTTLYTFIKNKFNASKTADDLYIHRSTLLARLNKINSVSYFDLDDFNIVLHLMISFYLMNDI
ncbi:hypothetical protein TVTCOM_25970 [Terrisporobacter vanillatitrophus]